MQNTLDKMKGLIFSAVIKDAKKIPPLIDDHNSVWESLGYMQEELSSEAYIGGNFVDDYFLSCIEIHLTKLPYPIQNLIWLETEKGQNLIFEIHYSKGDFSKIEGPMDYSTEETVDFLYGLLKVRAEEEFTDQAGK